MRAEDILPGRQDWTEIGGVAVRKGTVAAFLANARLWSDPSADAAARAAAERDIARALPSLRALGLFEVLEPRDPALREWLERATRR
ncbi:hypothetical protein [Bordetella petrii]|uniref:Preprotein translocase subunit SecD n=1 Tax=Bordetella petrii TaxID=94624 RepID=A0ABT7W0T5_9BORD|nr:hypothetical protein [Bordetella petrii]MDM9558788.1 hypothetical protein [Bordetella petrii]